MGESIEMVYDGLLCWFDGLDPNLTINSWPCSYGTQENVQYRSLHPQSRYNTTGSVVKLSNGIRLTATDDSRAVLYTYLSSSSSTRKENPLYNTTDTTIIIVASNLLLSKASSPLYTLAGMATKSGTTPSIKRTRLFTNNSIGQIQNWCGDGPTAATWDFAFQENMRGVFATRMSMSQNKQDFTAIANDIRVDGGFKSGCKYDNLSDDRFLLGGYNYIGTYFYYDDNMPGGANFQCFPGDYHALVIYNRILGDRELTSVMKFLKERYNV